MTNCKETLMAGEPESDEVSVVSFQTNQQNQIQLLGSY